MSSQSSSQDIPGTSNIEPNITESAVTFTSAATLQQTNPVAEVSLPVKHPPHTAHTFAMPKSVEDSQKQDSNNLDGDYDLEFDDSPGIAAGLTNEPHKNADVPYSESGEINQLMDNGYVSLPLTSLIEDEDKVTPANNITNNQESSPSPTSSSPSPTSSSPSTTGAFSKQPLQQTIENKESPVPHIESAVEPNINQEVVQSVERLPPDGCVGSSVKSSVTSGVEVRSEIDSEQCVNQGMF